MKGTHKRLSLVVLIISALILAACGQESSLAPAQPEMMEVEGEAAASERAGVAADTANVAFQPEVQERLIITTGNLEIVVDDTEESVAQLAAMAEALGGWVVSSNIYQTNEAKAGNVTLRIPAESFDEAVAQAKAMATEVRSESSNSDDVTEEYVDLNARLENLEATADRVRSFLDDARRVEDALAVNQELSRLEGEIEAMKGRIQYLEQSAAFSTLSVGLTPDELSQPIEIGGWQPEGVAKDAVEALLSFLQWLGTALIWVGIFCLPLGLIFGVPLFFLGRYGWRKRRERQARREAEEKVEEGESEPAEA
jgi:hypothetical protein